ncbi:MAG TPA: hypothetical protein VF757_00810, partial [Sphingomicrobium sp.]
SNSRFLLYDSNTTCAQLLHGGGLPSGAVRLLAEKSMSVLGFIPAPWGELCLFEYGRAVSGDRLRQAIRSSRHDGPYILAPRPEAVLERD